jgi:hypothetical protein
MGYIAVEPAPIISNLFSASPSDMCSRKIPWITEMILVHVLEILRFIEGVDCNICPRERERERERARERASKLEVTFHWMHGEGHWNRNWDMVQLLQLSRECCLFTGVKNRRPSIIHTNKHLQLRRSSTIRPSPHLFTSLMSRIKIIHPLLVKWR